MTKTSAIQIISLCSLILFQSNFVFSQATKKTPLTEEQIQAFRSTKTVKIQVTQSYKYLVGFHLPFEDVAERLFQYAGLIVVKDDSEDHDLLFRVNASGSTELGRSGLFSGATLFGDIIFEATGIQTYMKIFGSGFTLHQSELKENPLDGLFKLYVEDLIDIVNDIFGSDCVIAALSDEMREVQRCAANFLIKKEYPEAVEPLMPILIRDLKDDDMIVRNDAIRGLQKIGNIRAVMVFIDALTTNPRIRTDAIQALGRIGDYRAVDPIIPFLKDKDEGVRTDAIQALGRIGDYRAVDLIIPFLKDKDEDVRITAALALGRIGDPRAVEPLIAALGDDEHIVQIYVLEALQEMTGQNFYFKQKKWRKWWKKNKTGLFIS